MAEFWIGIRGDLTSEQIAALATVGLPVEGEFRQTLGGRGTPPEWETLRTFVRATGVDEDEAKAPVATALAVEPDDLLAYSADTFG